MVLVDTKRQFREIAAYSGAAQSLDALVSLPVASPEDPPMLVSLGPAGMSLLDGSEQARTILHVCCFQLAWRVVGFYTLLTVLLSQLTAPQVMLAGAVLLPRDAGEHGVALEDIHKLVMCSVDGAGHAVVRDAATPGATLWSGLLPGLPVPPDTPGKAASAPVVTVRSMCSFGPAHPRHLLVGTATGELHVYYWDGSSVTGGRVLTVSSGLPLVRLVVDGSGRFLSLRDLAEAAEAGSWLLENDLLF